MITHAICDLCSKPASSLHLEGELWICKHCQIPPHDQFYIREVGVENPLDPKGSTAHIRDIKSRRYHPQEKRMFRYAPPKTYFFPKG